MFYPLQQNAGVVAAGIAVSITETVRDETKLSGALTGEERRYRVPDDLSRGSSSASTDS